jgi:hypothetical protein
MAQQRRRKQSSSRGGRLAQTTDSFMQRLFPMLMWQMQQGAREDQSLASLGMQRAGRVQDLKTAREQAVEDRDLARQDELVDLARGEWNTIADDSSLSDDQMGAQWAAQLETYPEAVRPFLPESSPQMPMPERVGRAGAGLTEAINEGHWDPSTGSPGLGAYLAQHGANLTREMGPPVPQELRAARAAEGGGDPGIYSIEETPEGTKFLDLAQNLQDADQHQARITRAEKEADTRRAVQQQMFSNMNFSERTGSMSSTPSKEYPDAVTVQVGDKGGGGNLLGEDTVVIVAETGEVVLLPRGWTGDLTLVGVRKGELPGYPQFGKSQNYVQHQPLPTGAPSEPDSTGMGKPYAAHILRQGLGEARAYPNPLPLKVAPGPWRRGLREENLMVEPFTPGADLRRAQAALLPKEDVLDQLGAESATDAILDQIRQAPLPIQRFMGGGQRAQQQYLELVRQLAGGR